LPEHLQNRSSIPGAHDQGAGIVATAANAINPLRYVFDRADQRWSARTWSENGGGWLFLTSRDGMSAAVMPLLSNVVGLASSAGCSLDPASGCARLDRGGRAGGPQTPAQLENF